MVSCCVYFSKTIIRGYVGENAATSGELPAFHVGVAEYDRSHGQMSERVAPGFGDRASAGDDDFSLPIEQPARNHRVHIRSQERADQERQPLLSRPAASLLQQPDAEERAGQ